MTRKEEKVKKLLITVLQKLIKVVKRLKLQKLLKKKTIHHLKSKESRKEDQKKKHLL